MIADTMKISAAGVARKLHNLRYQMNSEVRKLKNKKVEKMPMKP